MLLVLGIVFAGRLFVLSNIDEQIEEAENEILELQNIISADLDLVEEYRYENIPSESQLTAQIPTNFSSDILLYQVEAHMHLSGIKHEEGRQITVGYNENVSFGDENSRFHDLSQSYFTNIVIINFLATDEDEIRALIDGMYEANQLFLLQSIRYEETDSEDHDYNLSVRLQFVTFYLED